MAALAGCGLIFGSTLATSALWRSTVSLDGGAVQSGSVVLLTGDTGGQVKSYAFTSLAGSALRPGSSVQAPLVVRNGGRSPLDYGLAQTAGSGASTLPVQLSLRLDVVSGICAAGVGAPPPAGVAATVYDGTLAGATTPTTRQLAPGAAETLCVRVGVKPDAPKTVSGASTTITFTFGAQPS